MAAVDTNSISLAICKETTPGEIPSGGAKAEYLEPNGIPDFGGSITTTARAPISANRQQRKGTITDFSSTVSVEQDLTVSSFLAVIDGAVLSEWQGVPALKNVTVGANKITLEEALDFALPVNTLLYFSGFQNAVGLKKLTGAFSKGGTELTVDGLTAEATKGTVFVVGYEAAQGDITSGTDRLLSTTLDFTTLPLFKGSAIYVGGETASNSFDTGISGLARVRGIEAHTLYLDKLDKEGEEDSAVNKTIRIFFGQFLRNVPVSDELFKEHSYSMEVTYPGIVDKEEGVADGYEYSYGNKINTVEIGMSVNDKATLNFTTFGTDTDPVTETSKGWEISNPKYTEAFSTPSDFLRLRVQGADEEGLTSFFKDTTISINNNISAENVLAKLGPAFTNLGMLQVSLSGNIVFTNPKVTEKIRNNCTCSADLCLSNNDGSIYLDLPRISLSDGAKDFAVNEKVKLSLSGESFVDDEFDYSVGFTFFPYLPTAKATAC